MTDTSQNPGRKWRYKENDGDGNKYFDNYRYTPFTTDLEFFRDPKIYEASDVPRTTRENTGILGHDNDTRPRGGLRSDERIKDEIQQLLQKHAKVDSKSVRVEVQDGMIRLSGNVGSLDERRTVEGITRNVLGVLEVRNELSVRADE